MLTKLTALEVTPAALYGKFSNARICDYLKYMFSLISTSLGDFLSEQLDEYTKQVEAHDQAHAEILKESDNVYAKVGDLKKDMLTTEAKFNRKWLRFVQLYRKYLERNRELGLPLDKCQTSLIYRDYPSLLAKTEAKTLPVSVLCDHILERYDFKKDKRIAKVLCEVEKENQWRQAIPVAGKCSQESKQTKCDASTGGANAIKSQVVSLNRNDQVNSEVGSTRRPFLSANTSSLLQHFYCDNGGQAVFKTATEFGQCLLNPILGRNDEFTQSRKRKACETMSMPDVETKRARTNPHCHVTVKAEPPAAWSGLMHRYVANEPEVLQPRFKDNVTRSGQGRPNGLQLHQVIPNDPKLHQLSQVRSNDSQAQQKRPNDPQPYQWVPNVTQPQNWGRNHMQEAIYLQEHHVMPNGPQSHHWRPNVPQQQQMSGSHMQEASDLQLHHLRPNGPQLHHWRPTVPQQQQRHDNHMQEAKDPQLHHMMPNGPQLHYWRPTVPQPQNWGESYIHVPEPGNVHSTGPWNPSVPCQTHVWSGNHTAARNYAAIDSFQCGWNNAAFQRSGPPGPTKGSHAHRRSWQNATQNHRNANKPYVRPEPNIPVDCRAFAVDQACYSERIY